MSDNSNFPADQLTVAEYYNQGLYEAGTAGEYVRVQMPEEDTVTCIGPTDQSLGETETLGWVVVEINWSDASMLLAPVTALYNVKRTTDRLDAGHHNAPKDGNDDPVLPAEVDGDA